MLSQVLTTDRGEPAVRVARARQDADSGSAAVHREPDRDATHVRTVVPGMRTEQSLQAHRAGTVTGLSTEVGAGAGTCGTGS